MNAVEPIRFGDKYLLLDQIGAGGVAEVFRGKLTRDKGFEKLIVIKKLLAEHNSDREMVDIFIREARLAALLQHDNIAATYDFGEIDGEYFLAMEYLFGKNLHSVLVRAREQAELFGLSEALVIGSKICEGMEYAHNLNDLQHRPLNIVHRDLTPHNIFVTYDGKVKILDFGVAKAELFDNKTREGVVKGKISYMSPERLSGEDVDCRSDIFSIGILLYEMIGKRRMYQGDTAELIRKCLTAEYDNLKTLLPELDPEVHQILDKALAVEVDRRYQSCAQMQSDIDDLLFQMQQRSGYRLLKGSIRRLFAEEYDTEYRKVAEVLQIDSQSNEPRDQTDIASTQDQRFRERIIPEDKTAMLLHRPPSHFFKLYWSRLSHWLNDKYRQFSALSAQSSIGSPFIIVGAVLVLLVFTIMVLTWPDQQDKLISASVDQEAGQEERRPVAEAEDGQKLQEVKAESQTLRVADETPNPLSSEQSQRLPEPVEPPVKGDLTAQTVAREATKVPVLKMKEMKKKQNLPGPSHRPVPPPAQTARKEMVSLDMAASQDARVEIGNRTLSYEERVEDLARKKYLISLHAKASEAMQQGRLVQPAQYNAHAYFGEILLLDPNDKVAADGLRLICEKYSALAEESLADKQYERAENYIADGLSVIPNYSRLIEVRKRIERERQEHIYELSEKARLCLEANKLSTPANDSAYFYYNEIFRLEPDNAQARKGFKAVADGYAKLAEKAFRDFDYKTAEVYVRRGLQIIPDHYYLLSLKEELGRSDLSRVGHSVKKKLNKFLSE